MVAEPASDHSAGSTDDGWLEVSYTIFPGFWLPDEVLLETGPDVALEVDNDDDEDTKELVELELVLVPLEFRAI